MDASPTYLPTIKAPHSVPSTPPTVIDRFRRSLSHRSYFSPKPTLEPDSAKDQSTSCNPPSSTIREGGIQETRRPKATPFERFLKLGRKKDGKVAPFPPSHWLEQEAAPQVTQPEDEVEEEKPLPDVPPNIEVSDDSVHQDVDEAPPEPVSLARRIQVLLSSLPSLLSSTPATAAFGEPVSPAVLADSHMISLLSAPSVMNGTPENGRQSVWSVLDTLKSKLPGSKQIDSKGLLPGVDREEDIADDSSSIMLYGPIIPTPGTDSEVELARSEIICDEEVDHPEEGNTFKRLHSFWPFSGEKGKQKTSEEGPQSEHSQHIHDRTVWLPSTTKISLQVMWWGYRIYLPPPVLALLDNKRIESAKRAAVITTALKWLLDHIPMLAIPPQFRPAINLLKGLVPYLGYVGAFVAWSWGAIKTFDKGHGVVLTATWLLPVALIPGTWEGDDFPELLETQGSSSGIKGETQSETNTTPESRTPSTANK